MFLISASESARSSTNLGKYTLAFRNFFLKKKLTQEKKKKKTFFKKGRRTKTESKA